MKAGVLQTSGEIFYEEVKKPVLNEREVLIKVKYAGICGGDFDKVFKTGRYYPIILGHEISGIVSEIGGKVKNVKVGDRVIVDPFIPCFCCSYCKKGLSHLCSNYSFIGTRQNGGFAEYVRVLDFSIIQLPDEISFRDGCQVEPLVMALLAIITEKDLKSVCIMGVGTAGSYLIKWAKALKIEKIVAVSRADWKLRLATELGATVVYKADSLEKVALEVDAVIDVSSSSAIEKDIALVKREGRIILVGTPHCDVLIKNKVYEQILRKEITIKGIWCSYFKSSFWKYVLDILSTRNITINPVVTHIFKLRDIEKAFKVKKHNKILLEI